MPRYFFHTVNGGRDTDEDGTELIDDAAAREDAIKLAGALIYDKPDLLSLGHEYRVEVADQAGDLLFTVVMLSIDAGMPDRHRKSTITA